MPDTNRTDIEWLKKSQAEIKAEMRGGFESLANKLDLYNDRFETKENAQREYDKLNLEIKSRAVKEDVDEIQSTLVWLNRIVIGAVILAILGFVMTNT